MRKGSKMSEESRRKMSVSRKGATVSEECRAKISKTLKGIKKTAETRARMSEAARNFRSEKQIENSKRLAASGKGRVRSQEFKDKISKTTKGRIGKPHTEESKKKLSLSHTGMKRTSESVAKTRAGCIGKKRTPEFCKNLSENRKGVKLNLSEAQIAAQSERCKKRWLAMTVEQKDTHIKRWRSNLRMTPNHLESDVQIYLNQQYPGEWRFNKNEFSINNFIPDFINNNGKKIFIEVFGDYWHRNDNPKGKIAMYASYGFHCIVVWEAEFRKQPDCLKEMVDRKLALVSVPKSPPWTRMMRSQQAP